MLVADPAHRRRGVGRELIGFAERWSQAQGLATMQLELLVPRHWRHPAKEFLKAWYTRIGYRPIRTGLIEESYPELAPHLATPCDFVIYHKHLPTVERATGTPRKILRGHAAASDHPRYNAALLIDQVSFTAHPVRTHRHE
jgi:Acetyltransferase (GNAT) family